jgi:hypothetical protein
MSEFRVQIGEEGLTLEPGNCAVVMFRKEEYRHMDYLMAGEPVRPYHNVLNLCRWMAGYMIQTSMEDMEYTRPTTFWTAEDGQDLGTFYGNYGWNPSVLEKDQPNPTEISEFDAFIADKASDIDAEWEQWE